MVRLAVVLGTYNRIAYLRECVKSIRSAIRLPFPESASLGAPIGDYKIIVVDGGSTDGSRTWLSDQPDVVMLGQVGPLTGAVTAFNLGFGLAVDGGFDFVANFNDDAFYLVPGMLSVAIARLELGNRFNAPPDPFEAVLEARPPGMMAFHFDLPGRPDGFEYINGLPYANFGLVHCEVGMAVARAQGDPSGRSWWNPIYHTYGADSEFGAWVWNLGWRIERAPDLKVQDAQAMDDLRRGNTESPRRLEDGRRFWRRWPSRDHILKSGPECA